MLLIVQEKLDGYCVAVARIDGSILPLGRAGYPAITSPYEQHRHFANWVYANQDRFFRVLNEGERLCGEWLMQAHGTRYVCSESFVAFDIMRGPLRLPYSHFHNRVAGVFSEPHVISLGPPLAIVEALNRLGTHGFHGALIQLRARKRLQKRCFVTTTLRISPKMFTTPYRFSVMTSSTDARDGTSGAMLNLERPLPKF